MSNKRKRHSADFKSKVALEASKEIKTLNEIASDFGIHPVQVSQWKNQLLDNMSGVFSKNKSTKNYDKIMDDILRELGQKTMELEWLKKKLVK